MDQKAIIAIAVVAVLAVGGCAAAVMYMNDNGGNEPLKVDKLRTDLKAGDYVKYSMSGTSTSTSSHVNASAADLLSEMLYNESASSLKEVAKGQYEYKNKFYDYVTYNSESGNTSYYYDLGTNNVVYRYTVSVKDSTWTQYSLSDSNLDITLNYSEQIEKIVAGSFYKYSMEIKEGDNTQNGTVTTHFSSYDVTTKTGTMVSTETTETNTIVTDTIKSVSDDGKTVTLTTGKTESMNEFLSYVSKDALVQYLKDSGGTFTEGDKTVPQAKDIPGFGKRNVTTQFFNVVNFVVSIILEVNYGDNGVIYGFDMSAKYPGSENKYTMTVMESNLISTA